MDMPVALMRQFAATFPLIKNEDESQNGTVVFNTTLSTKGQVDFLERSGDGNWYFHHPKGKKVVQGFLWLLLCNAAVSLGLPGAVMLTGGFKIRSPCFTNGRDDIAVEVRLRSKVAKKPGEVTVRLEVWASARPGRPAILIFTSGGKVQLR